MIEIYRFGHYVNEVSSREELHRWLLDNLPYKMGACVPEGKTLKECYALAKEKNFTFKTK